MPGMLRTALMKRSTLRLRGDPVDFLKRKVLGVPVLYLLALGVGVLAFFAWKMKPSAPSDTPTDSTDSETGMADMGGDAGTYDYLRTNGTVTVSQGSTPDITTPVTVRTNATWRNDAINWLVGQGAANGGDAQTAIDKYLGGEQLSIPEGKLRDAAIKQFGIPPEPFENGGTQAAIPLIPPQPSPVVSPTSLTRSSFIVSSPAVAGAAYYQAMIDGRTVKQSATPSIAFTGLKPNTPYRILMRSVNSRGQTNGWAETFVRTKP